MGHNRRILMKSGPKWRKFHGEFDFDGPGGRKTAKTWIFTKILKKSPKKFLIFPHKNSGFRKNLFTNPRGSKILVIVGRG